MTHIGIILGSTRPGRGRTGSSHLTLLCNQTRSLWTAPRSDTNETGQTVWTRLGNERPHWSVLSADQFSPEQISGTAQDFFASGGRSCFRAKNA